MRELRGIEGIKKVFIRSGIRFDYLIESGNDLFLRELCEHHVSGQLKVASRSMSPPGFCRPWESRSTRSISSSNGALRKMNEKLGKKQYLVPYFISSHPGSTLNDAVELALFFQQQRFIPEQVQDFYPTPGTLATCMYYTGIDPRSMRKIYVPRSADEKRMQRALLQFNRPGEW